MNYYFDPSELDRGMFEEMWRELVEDRPINQRRVILRGRIKSKIIELYGMILRLERAKREFSKNKTGCVIISRINETVYVLKRGIDHWRNFYLNY